MSANKSLLDRLTDAGVSVRSLARHLDKNHFRVRRFLKGNRVRVTEEDAVIIAKAEELIANAECIKNALNA